MTKRAKFAGARIVFDFAIEDEAGDTEMTSSVPLAVKASNWRKGWRGDVALGDAGPADAAIAAAIAELEAVPEPTGPNREQRRSNGGHKRKPRPTVKR